MVPSLLLLCCELSVLEHPDRKNNNKIEDSNNNEALNNHSGNSICLLIQIDTF